MRTHVANVGDRRSGKIELYSYIYTVAVALKVSL